MIIMVDFVPLISDANTSKLLIILIILVIIFSPITYALVTKIYKSIKKALATKMKEEQKVTIAHEIETASVSLLEAEKGGTVVIDIRNETDEYINGAEYIDSRITANLIINIFEGSKTPLHDGAIIISENRIKSASAYITKLSEQIVPKRFGTRHRSALGLSEVTKAIIIVLSEESGKVRIFHNSKWKEVNRKELFDEVLKLWV